MAETATKKPAAAKKPAAKKEPARQATQVERHARVSKFNSHGSEYTMIRVPRVLGDTLAKGTLYDAKKSDAGVITLTPTK